MVGTEDGRGTGSCRKVLKGGFGKVAAGRFGKHGRVPTARYGLESVNWETSVTADSGRRSPLERTY